MMAFLQGVNSRRGNPSRYDDDNDRRRRASQSKTRRLAQLREEKWKPIEDDVVGTIIRFPQLDKGEEECGKRRHAYVAS